MDRGEPTTAGAATGGTRPSTRSVGRSAAPVPTPAAAVAPLADDGDDEDDDDDDDDDDAVSMESSAGRKTKRCQAPRQSRANESTSIYNRLWAPLLLLPPIRVRSFCYCHKIVDWSSHAFSLTVCTVLLLYHSAALQVCVAGEVDGNKCGKTNEYDYLVDWLKSKNEAGTTIFQQLIQNGFLAQNFDVECDRIRSSDTIYTIVAGWHLLRH